MWAKLVLFSAVLRLTLVVVKLSGSLTLVTAIVRAWEP